MKVEEQVEFLKNKKTGIAVGTPARLIALIENGKKAQASTCNMHPSAPPSRPAQSQVKLTRCRCAVLGKPAALGRRRVSHRSEEERGHGYEGNCHAPCSVPGAEGVQGTVRERREAPGFIVLLAYTYSQHHGVNSSVFACLAPFDWRSRWTRPFQLYNGKNVFRFKLRSNMI